MPQAKKPASPARRAKAFNEPAALKRLNKSLDTAHEALAELRKGARRDVGGGAQDLYKDLRTFVSDARRDAGKLAKALQRDFEQAEKLLTQLKPATASRGRAAKRPATASRRRAAKRPATASRGRAAKRPAAASRGRAAKRPAKSRAASTRSKRKAS